ncbi:hypothetical protein ACW4YW_02405 [Methylobacillus pratensis]
MSRVFVIGEDVLCCTLGTKLVEQVLKWELAQPAIDTKGITNLRKNLARYTQIANLFPVLCIADTDGRCVLDAHKQAAPTGVPAQFHLRFAIPEIESWLMADKHALAEFLQVSETIIPDNPDEIQDAKRVILNVVFRSKQRHLRQEMISTNDRSKPGTGYNVHLRDFAAHCWRPLIALERSPSLARTVNRLNEMKIAK